MNDNQEAGLEVRRQGTRCDSESPDLVSSRRVVAVCLSGSILLGLWSAGSVMAEAGLSIGSARSGAGTSISAPLSLSGASNVVALQADIVFDSNVLNVGATTAGPALSGQTFASSQPANGTHRVLVYSLNNAPLSPGVIANFHFNIAPGTHASALKLSLTNVILADSNAVALASSNVSGLITVPPPPITITLQPQSQTAVQGGSALFRVSATSALPLKYQWRFNGANLPATNETLFLTNVQSASEGIYRVLISSEEAAAVSKPATLTVAAVPSIIQQPVGANVAPGANVTLHVVAGGTPPLGYEWRRNGSTLSGATSANLLLSNVNPSRAGDYVVVVSNIVGAVTSAVARVNVGIPSILLGWSTDQAHDLWKLHITWTVSADFILQASTNLTDWLPVVTNAATAQIFEYVDLDATRYRQRFYRVVTRP